MLVRARLSNILSFRGPVELNLTASRERIHPEHVVQLSKSYQPRLLRTAVLYGANASGKSNFVKGIAFAQELINKGTQSDEEIPLSCFRLDHSCADQVTEIGFEFVVEDELYLYGLKLTPSRIHHEWLYVLRTDYERLLFERRTDSSGETGVEFGDFADRLVPDERQFLSFVARGTRPNQPFLTEAAERNVTQFKPQIDWFKNTLTTVTPDDPYGTLEVRLKEDRPFKEFFAQVLQAAGTDISGIETHEEELDALASWPESLRRFASEHVSENNLVFTKDPEGRRLALVHRDSGMKGVRITTMHRRTDGSDVATFEVHEESDGTQRLFDLIPIFYELITAREPKVVLIDEVGRSLHPHLVRLLFELHLEGADEGAGNRTQLIATTHDTSLIDLDLLRRDEIWFVEKDENQASQIYSLHEFEPRYDKDVRKDYLLGRYGGIPFLGSARALRAGSGT